MWNIAPTNKTMIWPDIFHKCCCSFRKYQYFHQEVSLGTLASVLKSVSFSSMSVFRLSTPPQVPAHSSLLSCKLIGGVETRGNIKCTNDCLFSPPPSPLCMHSCTSFYSCSFFLVFLFFFVLLCLCHRAHVVSRGA